MTAISVSTDSLVEFRESDLEEECSADLKLKSITKERDVSDSQSPPPPTLFSSTQLHDLVSESTRLQLLITQQLHLLNTKVESQTDEILDYKKEIKKRSLDTTDKSNEIERLKSFLVDAESKIECLKYSIDRLQNENAELKSKLEQTDATVGYYEALAHGHRVNMEESETRIKDIEKELEVLQTYYAEMEDNFQQIEAIRYEIVSEEETKKPIVDFVEDLIQQNTNLGTELAEERKRVIETECKILDTEFSLKAANEQNESAMEEKDDMQHSLHSVREHCRDLEGELEALTAERELYQDDIKAMLERLKKMEQELAESKAKHRESEVISSSFQEQLSTSLDALQELRKEKTEALTMVQLKEDVIRTLQKSIDQTTSMYMNKLDKYIDGDEVLSGINSIANNNDEEQDGEKILTAIEERFGVLSREIDRKDNMIIQMIQEKEDLLGELEAARGKSGCPNDDVDLQEAKERLQNLENKIRKKQTQLEENELVINHLVSVINRYARADGSEKPEVPQAGKRNSDPAVSSRGQAFFSRISFKSKSVKR